MIDKRRIPWSQPVAAISTSDSKMVQRAKETLLLPLTPRPKVGSTANPSGNVRNRKCVVPKVEQTWTKTKLQQGH